MTLPYDPELTQPVDPSYDPATGANAGNLTPVPEQTAPVPEVATPTTYLSKPTQQAVDPMALLKPVGTVSGGTVSSSSRVDLGPAGKAAEQAKQAADQSTIAAGDKQAQSNTERLQAQEAAANEKVKVQTEWDAKLQLQQAAIAKRSEEHFNNLNRAADDAEKAGSELDPDRYWHQMSTGKKIGNIISIALSGIGNVFQAKAIANGAKLGPIRNGAMDMIDSAIDRDIEMQKTALAAKQKGVQTREGIYSAARQAGADEMQATVLTRDRYLGKVDRDLEVQIAHANSEESKQAGERLRAQVQQQQATEKQKLAELTATHVQSQVSSKPILQGEVLAMQGQMQAGQDATYRKEHGLVEKDPKLATPLGQAPDPATRKEVADKYVEYKRFDSNITQLESMVKLGYLQQKLNPQKQQAFDRATAGITNYLASKDFANTGASMTPNEYELKVAPFLPGGGAWASASGKKAAAVKALRSLADLQKKSLKEAYTVPTE